MLLQNTTAQPSGGDVSNCGMKTSLTGNVNQTSSYPPNAVTTATGGAAVPATNAASAAIAAAAAAAVTASNISDHHFQTASPVNDNVSLQVSLHWVLILFCSFFHYLFSYFFLLFWLSSFSTFYFNVFIFGVVSLE